MVQRYKGVSVMIVHFYKCVATETVQRFTKELIPSKTVFCYKQGSSYFKLFSAATEYLSKLQYLPT